MNSNRTPSELAVDFLAEKIKEVWPDILAGKWDLRELLRPLTQESLYDSLPTSPRALGADKEVTDPYRLAEAIAEATKNQDSWQSLVEWLPQMSPQERQEISLIDLIDQIIPRYGSSTE